MGKHRKNSTTNILTTQTKKKDKPHSNQWTVSSPTFSTTKETTPHPSRAKLAEMIDQTQSSKTSLLVIQLELLRTSSQLISSPTCTIPSTKRVPCCAEKCEHTVSKLRVITPNPSISSQLDVVQITKTENHLDLVKPAAVD